MKVAVIYDVKHGGAAASLKAAIEVGDYSWARELLDEYGTAGSIMEYVD